MQVESASAEKRALVVRRLECDLAVVGGGLAGVCCAIGAARAGLKVVLLQDRPVLGGNASSEVRLWILGATSHMGNNNRWAREGGIIDEILTENQYRNREGNPCILDTILLEKVVEERNLTLLLNTAVHDLEKSDPDTIKLVRAFCAINSTMYEVAAPLFCDASGDGVAGFLAGAAFRIGAEGQAEFGERFAPAQPSQELLGHTIYFFTKDTGKPVKFYPPSFALKDIKQIPRYRDIGPRDQGGHLWWLEWGGRLDTIHDAETIKWELWKVAYGVWDYIKNSGKFPEAETMTLEWVGSIPGKRESRRFEGDYILRQQDIVEQRTHADAVSFGGWAIDLHPVDGVYSDKPGCVQWHAKGVYQIPYRCFYSRNITNLFLAGRIISASHVAFGSTRVMATCADGGQAVGVAAALCRRYGLKPRELLAPARMEELQRELLRVGHYIPGLALNDPADLARTAQVTASSRMELGELKSSGEKIQLTQSWGMLLPVQAGRMPKVTFAVAAASATKLEAQLRTSSRLDNHTPDVTLATKLIELQAGRQEVALDFGAQIDQARYVFVCLLANDQVAVELSDQRLTGVLAVTHNQNKAVAKSATQTPPRDIGIDSFEYWTPLRRPRGKNLAIKLEPALDVFGPENVINGLGRPTRQPNGWVAAPSDAQPTLTLAWPKAQRIAEIELTFDTDFDHPMESVLMGHPENVMPFCVRQFRVKDAAGRVVAECQENHQARCVVRLAAPVATDRLTIELTPPAGDIAAALLAVRIPAL